MQYGIYIFELMFPHSIEKSSKKIFIFKVFDFKNKKSFTANFGDKLKLIEYIKNDFEIHNNIIPINEEKFLKILNTNADKIIGKNKINFFKEFIMEEWII